MNGNGNPPASQPSAASTRECPFCKEDIRSEATKCKHCGSHVEAEMPSHGGTCPFCKESVKAEAIKCKHCGSWIGEVEKAEKGCSCPEGVSRGFTARLAAGGGDDYGQGCFYDCMDEHIGHGDDPKSPQLHRECERKCRVSMPTYQQVAQFMRHFGY